MKSVIYRKYGGPEVFQVEEVPTPSPKDKEVLVKIAATTATKTESTFRQGKPYFSRLFTGPFKPRIRVLGDELAGTIEAVGKDVTRFKVGDKVYGTAGDGFGAYAEYISLPETAALAPLPKKGKLTELAAVDGVLTALPFLRDAGQLQPGQRLLVNGASGSVGSAAVQIGKLLGAEVTGVCSTANVELVKSLGANHVIDYKSEDFTRGEAKYDVIFDTIGNIHFSHAKRVLTEKGLFLAANIDMSLIPKAILSSMSKGKRLKIMATGLRKPLDKVEDLLLLTDWIEKGKYKPLIDRSYPLEEIAEAHTYVDTGRKKGNIILVVDGKS